MLDRYERIVLWGGRRSLDSSRHVYRHYYNALLTLIDRPEQRAFWVDDDPKHLEMITPGSLVFVWNIWAEHLGRARPDVAYVTHNMGPEYELTQTAAPEQQLHLQVYTNDAAGDRWDECRLFHKGWRTLFQPWGTDLMAHEFWEPAWNPVARECCFVGAVWDDGGLGNAATIPRVASALERRGLSLVTLTHVTDAENVAAVRRSRIAPAFAGRWQVEHNYLPCRVWKNVSYGALAVTNVPKFRDLFADSLVMHDTVEETVEATLALPRDEYVERVVAQQDVARRYTYRESWLAIECALEEIA